MDLYTIETERLVLKKISPDEFRYVFENYTEPEIKMFFGHNSEEEYQKEKSKYEKGYTTYNRSFEHFQIIDKASNCIIGGCGFHNWYIDHRRAELGYSIKNEAFKGRGIMSEALKVIIDYGFNKINLHRIEALVGPGNVPSLKLMEKYRFVKEGLLRQHYFVDGKFENSIVFSKLRSD
jgi:[ribosomal protein S5]-alanine N-acetyltransferase